MKRLQTIIVAALQGVLASTLAFPAAAQDWPVRNLRVVVPFAAGSSPDILARIINDKLATRIGQAIIVENKAGGGGNTGTDLVAKATPDGYTFLLSVNAPLVYNTVLYPKLPYDPFRDLMPVTLAAATPNVCVVSSAMGVDTVKAWLAAMRDNPGKLNFASTGNGSISHLGVELIKLKTNSFSVHIPYTSSGSAVTAILQSEVQFGCLPAVAVMPHVRSGRLKALAVMSADRSQLLPDLPTLRESGLPDVQAFPWFAYMAPKGTPPAIVDRMNREIVAILQDPEVRKRLQTNYFDPIGSTAEHLGAFMVAERARWKPVIERAGIKPD